VLDPCCGSGTTLVAAKRLGRIAIGCDTSAAAVRLTRTRLSEFK
jgi:site-specific DNA-methyltransferase (adenine-specific)